MNTTYLNYFNCLYRYQSFNSAAKQIPITVQGLRRAIKSLESELGVDLYFSTESGITFTECGERLHRFSLEIEVPLKALSSDLQKLSKSSKSSIRVGFSFGSYLLFSDYLEAGFEAQDDMSAVIETDSLPEAILTEKVENGDFDFAITWGPPTSQNLQFEHLVDIQLCVTMNRKNPLAVKKSVTIADLSGQDLISTGDMHRPHQLIQEAFEAEGIKPNFRYLTSEIPTTQRYLAKNLGICFALPRERSTYPSDSIAFVPLQNFAMSLGIIWRTSHVFSYAENIVLDCLRLVKTPKGTSSGRPRGRFRANSAQACPDARSD
jgi:DNA-binding transcriptional LysR family regulator